MKNENTVSILKAHTSDDVIIYQGDPLTVDLTITSLIDE